MRGLSKGALLASLLATPAASQEDVSGKIWDGAEPTREMVTVAMLARCVGMADALAEYHLRVGDPDGIGARERHDEDILRWADRSDAPPLEVLESERATGYARFAGTFEEVLAADPLSDRASNFMKSMWLCGSVHDALDLRSSQ